MARGIGNKVEKTGLTVSKRTSQGRRHKPKGKHARKNWKRYRGQG